MTVYWRRKGEVGALVRPSSFMGGNGPAPEYRDQWEEVQVVPVDAVVVELPEVVLDFRSSSDGSTRWEEPGTGKGSLFSRNDDLDARERNALRHLAAIRAERVRRAEAEKIERERELDQEVETIAGWPGMPVPTEEQKGYLREVLASGLAEARTR
jgi:hypothetical protein